MRSATTFPRFLSPADNYGLAAVSDSLGAKFSPSIIAKIANKLGSKPVWNFRSNPDSIKQPDANEVKIDEKQDTY